MARLSLIEKEQLPPAFAALAEKGETASPFIKSTFYQILAHCPEMYQQYFPFYNTWHEGGKVAPASAHTFSLLSHFWGTNILGPYKPFSC